MDDLTPGKRRTGRPKDMTIDERALEAARQLLVEEGFAATTIQSVAERADVHASALYRRWPSRLGLIEDAVFLPLRVTAIRPTGNLRSDLSRFLRAYLEMLEAPAVRAAMPGLIAGYQARDQHRSPSAWLRLSLRPKFKEILDAAPADAIDRTLKPDDVFDLLLGSVLVRVVVPDDARRPPSIGRTVDLLLRVLQPLATRCAKSPSSRR